MRLYRVLMALAAPLAVLWAGLRVLRGRERAGDLRERLGLAPLPRDARPSLWVHAASNGELASCEAVLRAMLRAEPRLHLLVTTNSTTGRALAQGWRHPRVTARLAPFDWRWAAGRLIGGHDVRGLLVVEAEFWPNRIFAHADRALPVCVIGARLSRKTARGWRRAMRLVRPLVRAIALIVPQDEGSRRRFLRLGVPAARLGPVTDLKAQYDPADKPGPDPALAAIFDRETTWLAASTHPGEDEIVLDAHLAARRDWPGLELILAPRHPARGDEIAALAEARGLEVTRRSAGAPPRRGAVHLADTLGEMPRLYAGAAICLVAGSLVDRGGHTPFEPAAHGCALLHGPFLRNFQAPYRRLAETGAAREVSDAAGLAAALVDLRDPARRAIMARQAALALADETRPDALAQNLLSRYEIGTDPHGKTGQ